MHVQSWTVPHGVTRKASTPDETPTVFVVDDDISVRDSLELLIESADWRPQTFESAKEFLAQAQVVVPNCLILDVNLPDLNGLDLQRLVSAEWTSTPIIFVSGYGDIPMTVRAMKAGAVEFLTKPLNDEIILTTIEQALERSRAQIALNSEMRALRERYATLSRREREVMALVVSGLLNKQIAFELGISEITVKAHRGSLMRKIKATSLAHLVKLAAMLGSYPSGLSGQQL